MIAAPFSFWEMAGVRALLEAIGHIGPYPSLSPGAIGKIRDHIRRELEKSVDER